MEKKQIEVKILAPETILIAKLFSLHPQEGIEKLTTDDIKKIELTEEDKKLGIDSFYAIEYSPELDSFLGVATAASSTLIRPYYKEVFSLPNKKIYISLRLMEAVKEITGENPFPDLSLPLDQVKENFIKINLLQMLKEDLKLASIGEGVFILIGKAYRETWDIIHTIRPVLTTFRVEGKYPNDKFSGFSVFFESDLEELKKLFAAVSFDWFTEDLSEIIKRKGDETN